MENSRLTVTISEELKELLIAQSEQLGISVEEFANTVLLNALSDLPEGEKQSDLEGNSQKAGTDKFLGDDFLIESYPSILNFGETRFTDDGARSYTKAARYEFQKHASLKGLSFQDALNELSEIASKYKGDIELISRILKGRHELTGNEMTLIVGQTGNCPMQKTLQEWSRDSLPSLCRVFVQAIEV